MGLKCSSLLRFTVLFETFKVDVSYNKKNKILPPFRKKKRVPLVYAENLFNLEFVHFPGKSKNMFRLIFVPFWG